MIRLSILLLIKLTWAMAQKQLSLPEVGSSWQPIPLNISLHPKLNLRDTKENLMSFLPGCDPSASSFSCNVLKGVSLFNGNLMDNFDIVPGDVDDWFWVDFGAQVRIQRIQVYMANAKLDLSQWDIEITIWISDRQFTCATRDNAEFAVPVAKIKFSKPEQYVVIDLGSRGRTAKFLGITHWSPFQQWSQKKRLGRLSITELAVFGLPLRPSDFVHSSMPSPRETSVSVYPYRDSIPNWANLWDDQDNIMSTDAKYGAIVPFGENTFCALGCFKKCNTVVGLWEPSGSNATRIMVTTNEGMLVFKFKSSQNILDYLCNGQTSCSYLYLDSKTPVPSAPLVNKVLMLSTRIFDFSQANVRAVRNLMNRGQPVAVYIDWRIEHWTSEPPRVYPPELEQLIYEMKVAKVNIALDSWTDRCWKGDCPRASLLPRPVYMKAAYGVYAHALKGSETQMPEGSDRLKVFSSMNTIDYLRPWFKDFVPCLFRLVPTWIALWSMARFDALYVSSTDVLVKPNWPGISTFPQSPSPVAPKDAIVVHLNDRYGNKWMSTSVGNRGGTAFAIRLLALSNIDSPSRVRVNHFYFRDWLGNLEWLARWPSVISSGGSMLGFDRILDLNMRGSGLLMAIIERSNADPSQTMYAKLAISGVYSTAMFDRKDPNRRALWEKSVARTYFPIVVLTGDRAQQGGEISATADVPFNDIDLAVKILDDWVKVDYNYRGADPYTDGGPGQFLSYDWQISLGYMHSGTPIQGPRSAFLTSGPGVLDNGAWGHCHELGHNLNPGEAILVNFVEVTNNVLCWIDYLVTGVKQPMYTPGTRFCPFINVKDSLVNGSWINKIWPMNGLQGYEYFCYFGWRFGVGSNGNAWKELTHNSIYQKQPLSGWSREERYAHAMSLVTGFNMAPYHNFTGIPTSQTVWDYMAKQFPVCWLPSGDKYADMVQGLIADFQTLNKINCTGKAFTVTPQVDYSRYLNYTDSWADATQNSFWDFNQKTNQWRKS